MHCYDCIVVTFWFCIVEVSELIQYLHVYLLRRIKKNVPGDRWERELVKFCFSYSQWDAWELEERGYAKLKLKTRLAIIRVR